MTIRYVAIPTAALFDPQVTPQHLRTLSIIAYYGSLGDKAAYPSYSRLAADIKISKRLVMTYIKHLVGLGYLVKKERLRPNGSRTSNVYQVPLNIEIAPDEADDFPVETSGGVVMPSFTTPSDAQLHQGSDAQLHPQNHTPMKEDKKNIKKSPMLSLAQWEEAKGAKLCIEMMMSWVKDNSLDPVAVKKLIEEFRDARQSTDMLFADYAATFKNHLRKGYLSKKMEQVILRETISSKATVFDKGLSL